MNMGFSVRVAVAEVKENTCENTYRLSRESGLARETFLSLKKPKYHMISEYKIITEKKRKRWESLKCFTVEEKA